MSHKKWWFLVACLCGGCAFPAPQAPMNSSSPPADSKLKESRPDRPPAIDQVEELALARRAKRGPRPDSPAEAAEFRYRQRLSENGLIPPNALMRAKSDRDRSLAAAQLRDGGITNLSWTELGPGNIGGRIRSIIIHPTTPSTMWLGSVGGGIWKTTNGGASWQTVGDFLASLPIGCMAIDPFNPNVLYAGTGEGFGNSDALPGAGIFRSVDGGATWAQLPSTIPTNPDPTQDIWGYVNRIAISPTSGQVMIAGTRQRMFRTTDGGLSWTEVYGFRTPDVRFHPTDPLRVVAGTNDGNVIWSNNGGVTWTPATGITFTAGARVEVCWAGGVASSTVYASVNRSSGEIWRSLDNGQTWSLRNTGMSYLGSQGWYDNTIWVDPTNSSRVIVGGIDLWRSTNSGTNLSRISQWASAPASAHADHHTIVHHPGYNGTTNKTVYFGNDGGIYVAADATTVSGTNGWTALNNNLGITQFYGGAAGANGQVVIGGTQDNGTLRTDGSTSWTRMFGGDGGWCAADFTDPNYMYGEYVYCRIHRSTNGGLSSSYIYSGGPAPLTDAVSGGSSNANFISPFIIDPNNQNRILAGAARLWRSNNVKATTPEWYIIKSGTGFNVSAIAVAPGNPDLIWVGHNGGDVYKTTNGTDVSPTWTKMDDNSPGLPGRTCKRIAIDPSNHNRVYVSFSGYEANNMWRTDNSGATFTQITGPGSPGAPDTLPRMPVDTIALHPVLPGWLYVGGDIGVYASTDYGATWSSSNDGPANVAVDELIWRGLNTLVAVTHGRGMFEATIDLSTADCNGNSIPDLDEIAGGAPDCNNNGFLDSCEVAANPLFNCNGNAVPDSCELATQDCNSNSLIDSCELAANPALDCNSNNIIDACEPGGGDCNLNSIADFCELGGQDCDNNGLIDSCEMTGGFVGSDACADAPLAVPNTVYAGSTVNATSDGAATCDSNGANPKDVWFRYEPANSGSATISLCGTGYDATLSMHTACPGTTANEIACDDDFCGGGSGSQVTVNVSGGSTYWIHISGFDNNSAGNYQLRITGPTSRGPNDCNSNGVLDACEPAATGPAITAQPQPQDVCYDTQATFSVSAVGMVPISFQWRKNAVPIGGATSSTYSLPSATSGDAGDYDVVISNPCKSVISDAATLSVSDQPLITQQPVSQSACVGDPASLTVVASGEPLSYQWRKNGFALDGGTAATLTFSSVSTSDAATYDVVVTNSCGSDISVAVTLTVDEAPQISAGPQSVTICAGGQATFTVSAAGSPAPTYQWRRGATPLGDGGSISGSQTAMLVVNPAGPGDSGADYNCVVTNSCGEATSLDAELTVWPTGGGDLNGDSLVNGDDVPVFITHAMTAPAPGQSYCAADFNGDLVVDEQDAPGFVALLLAP